MSKATKSACTSSPATTAPVFRATSRSSTRAIADAGFDLTVSAIGQGGLRRQRRARCACARSSRGAALRHGARAARFDVNLMDERSAPELSAARAPQRADAASRNGSTARGRRISHSLDRVFAKTRHAVPIFEAQGCRTDFVGFTSIDRMLADVAREPTFFHLGGRSGNKGSQPLIDLWLRKPRWPTLTIIQRAAAAASGDAAGQRSPDHRLHRRRRAAASAEPPPVSSLPVGNRRLRPSPRRRHERRRDHARDRRAADERDGHERARRARGVRAHRHAAARDDVFCRSELRSKPASSACSRSTRASVAC